VVRLQIDPPEGGRFTSGFAGGTALSPDGTAVAYVASANGKSGLWIRPIDNTTARLIPGTEAASLPFWSPDNKSIAFFTGDKLQRVDPAGGALVTICYVGQYGVGVGGAWSSDGYIIFGAGTSGLFQVSATGGVASMLTTLGPSEIMHRWPQILPGGRFLYFAASYKREDSGVYIASRTKPGERVRLLTSDTSAVYAGTGGKDYLIWLRSGALVAQGFDTNTLKLSGEPHQVAGPIVTGGSGITNVSVSRTGLLLYGSSNALLTQLTWFDRTGRVLSVVDEPGEFIMFRLSPDGRRVITERVRAGVPDLWLLETARGLSSRFILNGGYHQFPIWSPNGRTIVFSAGVPSNLFRKEVNSAVNEQRLMHAPYPQGPLDWSRDGRWILYSERSTGAGRDLWVLPVTADGTIPNGSKPRIYLSTPFNNNRGRFSPEPSPDWVAYQSDESGRWEISTSNLFRNRGANSRSRLLEAGIRSGTRAAMSCITCRQPTD
jgi:Tol biopolymer transport system component